MTKITTSGKSASKFRAKHSVPKLRSQDSADTVRDANNNEADYSEISSEICDGENFEPYVEMDGLLKINKKAYSLVYQQEMPARDKCSLSAMELRKVFESEQNDINTRKRKRSNLTMCINSRYDIIAKTARMLGFRMVREPEQWNLCWTDSIVPVEFCREMRRYQKINHFPGMFEICRKDLLARNLNRMAKLFPLDYQIFPKTWCFPADLGDAITYSRQHKNKTYILKPDQGSQGKGIWLTKSLKDIKPNERMICQVYVSKPLLIDGYKFDLRVYALVTSTDPLRIFVYNEGLARFATAKYREPSCSNTQNMFMHLTNYSVNRHSNTFSVDDEAGSKRRISTINRILADEGYDIVELWANVDDIIVKTVLSAWPMLKHNYTASFPGHDVTQACFEILGIDILIDQNMKPFVLEVNHSPSFHTNEQVDKEVKMPLIRDTLVLLNISNDVKRRVLDEDKRRVKNRLLTKIRTLPLLKEDQVTTTTTTMDDALSVQVEWEESHLGDFRRVCPPPGDSNKYSPFFVLQSQASVYSETASSKRREECAKKQRLELEERHRYLTALQGNGAKTKLPRIYGEDEEKPWTVKKVRRRASSLTREQYVEWPIREVEERERVSLLAQRDFLIRTSGLLQAIYINFYRNNLLTEADRLIYNKMFANISSSATNEPLMRQLPHLNPYEQQKFELKGVEKTSRRTSNWMKHGLAKGPASKFPQLPASNPSGRRFCTET